MGKVRGMEMSVREAAGRSFGTLPTIGCDMDSSDLALLTTLDALLQESSVSRAADRLGLSTPAVSHALSRLRDRFDDPLLVRAGRAMVLTPRAVELAPRVRNAITHAEQVFSEPDSVDLMTVQREFALSATDYVMTLVGHAFSSRVGEEAPNVDLRILLNAVDDPQRLRRGESDLAIGIYADLPPELRTRPVIEDRLVCVVRGDHPEVGRTDDATKVRQAGACPGRASRTPRGLRGPVASGARGDTSGRASAAFLRSGAADDGEFELRADHLRTDCSTPRRLSQPEGPCPTPPARTLRVEHGVASSI